MARILLTGATGYLGSRVAARLDAAGLDYRVMTERLETLQPGTVDVDTVIHCAGAIRNRPDQLQSVNVDGLARLLAAVPVGARVVHVSSRSVYPLLGPAVVDESVPPMPSDEYGRTKLEAERLLARRDAPWVAFRSVALFGHPCRVSTFPDQAVDQVLAGQSVRRAVPDRDVDYLDVEVLAEVLVAACSEGPHWGRAINVAGPRRSLAGMLDAMLAAANAHGIPSSQPDPLALPLPGYPLLASGMLKECFPDILQVSDFAVFSRMFAHRLGVPAAI